MENSHTVDPTYWYRDDDISSYLDLIVTQELGGYKAGCHFLLCGIGDGKFPEQVAITPAIDSAGLAAPIDFYLDKNKQQPPDLGKPDTRRDAFDELLPILLQDEEQHAKILFPYNITALHWLTGEIKIYKKDHYYKVAIYAHDPYGGGEVEKTTYEILTATIQLKITNADPSARIEFHQRTSLYQARQNASDSTSCGVITAEDILKRITGASLNPLQPYEEGAKTLRKKQLEAIKKYLPVENTARKQFVERTTKRSIFHSNEFSFLNSPIILDTNTNQLNKNQPTKIVEQNLPVEQKNSKVANTQQNLPASSYASKDSKNTTRNLEDLKQFLKNRYKAHDQIERLFYPDHPLPLAECYLDLGLIDEKMLKEIKDKENKKDLADREYFLHDYERIQHIRRKLDVKAILQECQAPKKRIYIEGAAGAGKSTLSRFIANEWAHDKAPWNQYEWVFFIRLRDLDVENHPAKKELLQVVNSELFVGDLMETDEYEAFKAHLKHNSHQVLWILDGYDELSLDVARCNWWKDLLASNYHLLITSRPGAQLPKNDLAISLNLAVLGFSDEQVNKYVHNFFSANYTFDADKGDADKCLALLKNNINLWSLAHTPIQLELLCSSWKEFINQPDLPLTQLYRVILEKLVERHGNDKTNQRKIYAQLEGNCKDYLNYLEYLAFLGMQNKEILLNKRYVDKAYKDLKNEFKETTQNKSLLQELNTLGFVKCYKDSKLEFIHLNFQEFFAARYVAKAIKAFSQSKPHSLNDDNLLNFIAKTKWNPFYEVMWCFVAGLLGGKPNAQQQNIETYEYRGGDTNQAQELTIPKTHQRLQTLQTFFDLLLQEPRAELEAFELPLLAKCYAEAGAPNIMQKEAIKLHFQAWLQFYWGSDYADALRESAFQKLVQVAKNSTLLMNWLEALSLKLIKNWVEIKQVILFLILAINGLSPQAKLLLFSLSCMRQDRRMCTPIILLELISLGPVAFAAWMNCMIFKDQVRFVCIAVARAVGALGPAASEALQQGLVPLLQDQDRVVRQVAIQAVGALGPAANTALHQGLLPLLKDEDWRVRKAVAEAVGALGPAANAELQQGLLALLQDQYSDVRAAAAEAVSALGPAANAALQQSLFTLLYDKNKDMCEEASVQVLANTPTGLIHVRQAVFWRRPSYIPPSRLILSSKDTVQVNDRGEFINCLKLCGTVLQNIVRDGNQHNLTHEHWTIAMVRKKPTPGQNKSKASDSFFTSLKGLTSHASLLIEGVEQGVRIARIIDLKALGSGSKGQKIIIEVTDITDFSRLQQLADNSYCMVQGIPKEKVDDLMQLIKQDQTKAERGEIVYNQTGDGSAALGQAKQHSCVSWCLEKWQQIGLPLKRKWYDPIVVLARDYTPASEEKKNCLVM